MAGNFTGLRYDNEAYNEEVKRSTNPAMYRLDPNYAVNCNKCFSPHGARNGNEAAVAIGQQIDVDSVLRGIATINTKSNRHQQPIPLSRYQTTPLNECSPALESQYSRYTHPSFDIKGLNISDMRFGYPLHDPQCQIFENFEVNTRLQAKDGHKAIWQTPLDQKDSFPTPRMGRAKNCTVSVNCNYAPYQR